MRILHVNIGYPPFIGGAQIFTQEIARRLSQRGHAVEVWASDAGEVEHLWARGKACLAPGREMDRMVGVSRFPIRHLPLLPYSYHGLRRLALMLDRIPLASTSLLWHLARYTPWLPDMERSFQDKVGKEAGEFDLIHGWNIPFESLLRPAFNYARRHDIPFVITPLIHLGGSGREDVRRLYTMRHQLELLHQSDAIIALTPLEADYVLTQGIDIERVHVIGGGVDREALNQGDAARFRARYGLGEPFILFIGALNPHKGAHHLVEAMSTLWERGCDADLVMIGRPMERFRRFFDGLDAGARARCHLLGPVSDVDKADALAACALLALPSHTESFGLVYLEAWALGKPVIGARAGAVPAVIDHGGDGVLTAYGDVPALAEAIASLLDDPARAQAMGAAGQEKVATRYTWDAAARQIESLYAHLT